MRVGIVTHEYPRTTPYGGVGAHLRELVSALRRADIEVTVFAPQTGQPILDIPHLLVPLHEGVSNVQQIDVELGLRSWVREQRPDLVHIHHLTSLSMRIPQLLARMGVPYILHVHDMSLYCSQSHLLRNTFPPRPICAVPQQLEECAGCSSRAFGLSAEPALDDVLSRQASARWAIEHAACVVYVSQAIRAHFEDRLGYRSERHLVSYPALSWPTPVRSAEGNDPSGPLRLVMLGHVTAIKGLDIAVEAVELANQRSSRPIELHVFGMIAPVEPYRTATLQRAAQVSGITLHGAYAADQTADILASADWLVCASRFEASPLVVHEAAAAGVPTIGAHVGGIPEKVGAGGLLFEAGDPQALATALVLGCDPHVRARAAAALVRPPTIEDELRELIDVYREVAAHTSSPSTDEVRISVVTAGRNNGAAVLAGVSNLIEIGWNDDDELIVVDDASTDGTPAMLDALEGDVELVLLATEVGTNAALLEGLLAARGSHTVLVPTLDLLTLEPGWQDSQTTPTARLEEELSGAVSWP